MENYVSYRDFGAVGNGIANDFFAIKAAHEYANEKRLPVRAEAGKCYRITETELDGKAEVIVIKTDTDWCGAEIVIDDTELTYEEGNGKAHNSPIFRVESYHPSVLLEKEYIDKINAAGGLTKNSRKIETGLGYPAMLILRDETTNVFIRLGYTTTGTPQRELILVDSEGNIDESTPFLFDFHNISAISAQRVDIPSLTIGNATIISKASKICQTAPHYMNRGLNIVRPNTVIKDIVHKIVGEFDKDEPVYVDESGLSRSAVPDGYRFSGGAIYDKDGNKYEGTEIKPFWGFACNGMFAVHSTHNVLFENIEFQARKYYVWGSYDFNGNMSNAVVLKNCRQSNFFVYDSARFSRTLSMASKWWGFAGTNYCKNLIYDSSKLTRYDAHSGVVNGKVINCEIASLRLTGGGDMLIENSTVYYWGDNSTIQLREDYGSTWDGNVTFRNVKFESLVGDMIPSSILIADSANHYFGYRTYFPNIIIDNFEIPCLKNGKIDLLREREMTPEKPYRTVRDGNIATEGAPSFDGKPNVNPYTPPKFIRVINNEKNGYEITVPDVPFFRDTELDGVSLKD